MNKYDPITKLTLAEQTYVKILNTTSNRDWVLARLKEDLQTAIEIELATIPIYLYTYYSLIRNKTSGQNISEAQQFVNKAGGVIMSVAVEEMLHMSLSCNVLFALGGTPEVYKKSPGPYPTGLPYHNPQGPKGPDGSTAVSIPLSKLTYEQLWHFLQIEYPEKALSLPQDRNWNTIGQFYSNIRCLISTKFITDEDFQQGASVNQIQSDNYSQNNVDTVYPTGKFDPWTAAPDAPNPAPAGGAAAAAIYPNSADSHAGPAELVTVKSKMDALIAIDTICDQGEGNPLPGIGEDPTDDPSKSEDSHYYKFLTLQAQYAVYDPNGETLPASPPPPAPVQPQVTDTAMTPPTDAVVLGDLVVNFPDNPTTANYPADYQAISDFCNGLFQYMLVMTETIYKVPAAEQKLFFNVGLHRSMIWVLDKYIQTMRKIPIESGPYSGAALAPTFEEVDLGAQKDSFQALSALGDKAIKAAKKVKKSLPYCSPLEAVMNDVIYYVQSALTKTQDGHPMHLPDVGQYW